MFETLAEFVRTNPWIWLVLAGSFILWLVAFILVLRSPKFLRKFWWGFLTFVGASYVSTSGNTSISIGIPFGSLVVLGF